MTSVAHARPHAQGEGDAHHAPMSFWRKYIFSTDHKIIGIQFLFVSLFFLLVGGLLAMQIRWQLGFPGKPLPGGGILPETMVSGGVILPEYYVQLVSMHGTFMVFFAIMPLLVGVYANFLIPLKIGTELCGMGHYKMRARVFVHTPDEYKAWVAQQAAGGTE